MAPGAARVPWRTFEISCTRGSCNESPEHHHSIEFGSDAELERLRDRSLQLRNILNEAERKRRQVTLREIPSRNIFGRDLKETVKCLAELSFWGEEEQLMAQGQKSGSGGEVVWADVANQCRILWEYKCLVDREDFRVTLSNELPQSENIGPTGGGPRNGAVARSAEGDQSSRASGVDALDQVVAFFVLGKKEDLEQAVTNLIWVCSSQSPDDLIDPVVNFNDIRSKERQELRNHLREFVAKQRGLSIWPTSRDDGNIVLDIERALGPDNGASGATEDAIPSLDSVGLDEFIEAVKKRLGKRGGNQENNGTANGPDLPMPLPILPSKPRESEDRLGGKSVVRVAFGKVDEWAQKKEETRMNRTKKFNEKLWRSLDEFTRRKKIETAKAAASRLLKYREGILDEWRRDHEILDRI